MICGTDDVVHLVGAGDAAVHEQQRRQLVESLGVPSRHVVFRHVDRLPRTPGGKVDYQSIGDGHGLAREARLMELTNWRQLSDRGPDLVPCLDFPGGRAAAGFAELAAGVPVDACFLHFGQAGAGPLAACVDRWADELLATGRPVRAVLGFCAGTALATRLADAIAATGPPPMVVLFDAVPTTGDSLAGQFMSALESNARHLTADELADAHGLSEQLVETYPDDLPRIAAALTDRYDRLMRAVADRLSVQRVPPPGTHRHVHRLPGLPAAGQRGRVRHAHDDPAVPDLGRLRAAGGGRADHRARHRPR